jgi:Calcineurin-like phosphoesterase
VLVLAVSDEVDEGLWSDVGPVRGAELVVACGDLPFDYLGHLMEALDVPLVFVPGNHDPDVTGYRQARSGLILQAGLPAEPPWPPGAVNADGRVVDVAGLRVAGLGGSVRYSPGPNQYTQRQQRRRAHRLVRQARRRGRHDGRGVDLVLSHSAPRDVGDGPDPPHRGFAALLGLVAELEPAMLLHGHVRPEGRPARLGRTLVVNVAGRQLLDVAGGIPTGGRGLVA